MKKNILLVLITAIICIVGTASAAYVYTASDIGYQPQDNTWEVTNADQALTSLKEDLNNVNQNVTEYKQQITEALADKGVSVDENSSMADITSGIENFSSTNGLTAKVLAMGGTNSTSSASYSKTFTAPVDAFYIVTLSQSGQGFGASCNLPQVSAQSTEGSFGRTLTYAKYLHQGDKITLSVSSSQAWDACSAGYNVAYVE